MIARMTTIGFARSIVATIALLLAFDGSAQAFDCSTPPMPLTKGTLVDLIVEEPSDEGIQECSLLEADLEQAARRKLELFGVNVHKGAELYLHVSLLTMASDGGCFSRIDVELKTLCMDDSFSTLGHSSVHVVYSSKGGIFQSGRTLHANHAIDQTGHYVSKVLSSTFEQ